MPLTQRDPPPQHRAVSGRGARSCNGRAHSSDGVDGRLPHSFFGAIQGAPALPLAGQHQPRHCTSSGLSPRQSDLASRSLQQQRAADQRGCQYQGKGE